VLVTQSPDHCPIHVFASRDARNGGLTPKFTSLVFLKDYHGALLAPWQLVSRTAMCPKPRCTVRAPALLIHQRCRP